MQLTQAMLKAVAEILQLTVKLSDALAFDLVSAIARQLHGNTLANQLGVKKPWLSATMPALTLINRLQSFWNRRSPAARQRAIARTLQAFQQATTTTSQTTYQQNADNPAQQALPQTIAPVTVSD